jgi:MOSC domain-containing protein YiiM/GNAT superfamily N-acetyltransferase
VLQVNVSPGGVPKLPVERAWVGRLGLEGDAHREQTVHGGPHRAVCLFAIEVIERLQAEGHPIAVGGAGENLTTTGIEWSLLPVGTRARVGAQVELELASSTTPCATQVGNFNDGNFNRIRIDFHPSDSRMYARVVHAGEVKPGDPIVVLPPLDGQADDELLLKRLDRAETKSSVAAWRAAEDAGFAIDFREDGEIAMAASPDIPGPAFNSTHGLARLPNLLAMATDFYDAQGTAGWLWLAEPPWPGAQPELEVDTFAADPAAVAHQPPPKGVVVRQIGPGEAAAYNAVRSGNVTAGGISAGGPNPWPDVYERLVRSRSRLLFVAELDGQPVGNASLHVGAETGWLRGALVAPEARGRGIQRALVSARARAAIEHKCDLLGSCAEPGSISARNLARMGLRRVGSRLQFRYQPRV